jgi:hypothetical protein
MSRNQWTVLAVLGTAVVLVFACSCAYAVSYMSGGLPLQHVQRLVGVQPVEPGPATPTLTPSVKSPTATPGARPSPAARRTPPASTIDVPYRCGDSFQVAIGGGPSGLGPKFVYKVGDAYPRGTFLVVPITLQNMTNRTFDHLWETDYEIRGVVGGRTVTFTADQHASWNYSYGWKCCYAYFTDDVPPGVWFRTMVVFDVSPEGDDWTLVFKPDSIAGSPICQVEIPLRPPPQ